MGNFGGRDGLCGNAREQAQGGHCGGPLRGREEINQVASGLSSR